MSKAYISSTNVHRDVFIQQNFQIYSLFEQDISLD